MSESNPLHPTPRILSQADVAALVESRGASRSVNMLHPIELHVEREKVAALVRLSLQLMRQGHGRSPNETTAQRTAYELAMQQRVDFLGWLAAQDEIVHLAVYPADHDGLDELELSDIGDFPEGSSLDDFDTPPPDGQLPF